MNEIIDRVLRAAGRLHWQGSGPNLLWDRYRIVTSQVSGPCDPANLACKTAYPEGCMGMPTASWVDHGSYGSYGPSLSGAEPSTARMVCLVTITGLMLVRIGIDTYRTYQPYYSVRRWLPGAGWQPLPPDDVMRELEALLPILDLVNLVHGIPIS